MDYLKLFQTHEEYEAFVSGGTMLRPNVSHCVSENEIHYNPKPCTLTPKQLVEYVHSFMVSKDEKFLQHRQEHMDIQTEIYSNRCESKLARTFNNLNLEKNLRYRNFQICLNSADVEYTQNNSQIFSIDIINDLQYSTLRFDYDNMFVEGDVVLYKTSETYNGNDVFYITYYEQTYDDDDGTVGDLIVNSNNILYGDNMVLLCPHNTYANFTIAYPDGNGGYTTTKPASFVVTPSIVNEAFNTNSDWITITLFSSQDQEINTRVGNAQSILRSDFRNWFNGDFSALSVLDDIKMEFPRDVYEIIKNPWTYLDEEYIFNGQVPSNP